MYPNLSSSFALFTKLDFQGEWGKTHALRFIPGCKDRIRVSVSHRYVLFRWVTNPATTVHLGFMVLLE